jgi:exodeoxyribonuclease-3
VRLYSWNVNGVRSAISKGMLDWLRQLEPDVLCLQETKAAPSDLPDAALQPDGYGSYWATAQRRGYSGVATYTRLPVRSSRAGLGIERFDAEGRVVMTDLGAFELYNVYFPNGRLSPERLVHKLDFYSAFLDFINARVSAGRSVIFCGDVNTAHHPADLARPRQNEKISGFLPEERAWLDRWHEHGWVDTFRHRYPDTRGAYSWWSMRTGARERNIGWRLDYFFVHESFLPCIGDAGICADVTGADHCPIWLEVHV